MATKIVTKNSSTASSVPTAAQLVQGELAVNVVDKRLYTEDNAGAVVELGTNPSTLTVAGEITANGGIALGDNDKATFGASDDLQIYHDGSSSFIKDVGTGNLIIQATDLQIANADNTANYIRAFNGGAVDLRYAGSAKLATTSTGINVTGSVVADGLTVDGDAQISSAFPRLFLMENDTTDLNTAINSSAGDLKIFTVNDAKSVYTQRFNIDHGTGDISFFEDTGTTAKLAWSAANEDLNFADNVKATFGSGDDLQIYHDGSHSYISDTGQGDLRISGSSLVDIKCGDDVMLRATEGGSTQIRYDGSQKLATTSTGIDVTGDVVADALTLDSTDNTITFGDANTSIRGASATGGVLQTKGYNGFSFTQTKSGDKTRFNIADGGDVSFYEDTGTTAKMVWDASAESLGIGTSSPSHKVQIKSDGSSDSVIRIDAEDNRGASRHALHIVDSDSNARGSVNISTTSGPSLITDGSVGIGTSAPEKPLHVNSGAGNIGVRVESSDATASIEFMDSGTTSTGLSPRIGGISDDFFVQTSGSERMRIDSSGNVGIGTSSVSTTLHLKDTRATLRLEPEAIGGTTFDMRNGVSGVTEGGMSFYDVTNSATRLVIDSSGNLLVGKSASGADAGGEIRSTGQGNFRVDSSHGLLVDRKTNNGDLILFQKDGSTVGSIGSILSDLFIAEGNAGWRFDGENNQVLPCSTTGSTDGTMAIGGAGARVGSIYTAGGVYLGGTGAANKLDDYEEGTWTPATNLDGFTQSISSYSNATYVKIGKVVHVRAQINLSSSGYASSYCRITGLPFSADIFGTGVYTSGGLSGGAKGSSAMVLSGTSQLYLHADSTTATASVWYLSATYEAA